MTSPAEVVNYVENHDNRTLFDINAYKLSQATSKEGRARVQMLGAAINAFSQGVAYYHAGFDTLRSKSMDRNSDSWFLIKPRLADPALKPTGAEIGWTRDAFRDPLAIRGSSTLFRLHTAEDVKSGLSFRNTGSAQVPTVRAAHLDGNGYPGAHFRELLCFVNVDKVAQSLTLDADKGKARALHPVHLNGTDR